MNEEKFWSIIESGGREALSDPDIQLANVRRELRKLPPEEIREFMRLYLEKESAAYDWDLWGAAYLINGGCSDDGFVYFRDWLISRGRAVYEAAVENPDSLAGQTDTEQDDYEFEALGYVPMEVYEELTGQEMPPVDFHHPPEPRGKGWYVDEDDEETQRRLPNLSRIYLP